MHLRGSRARRVSHIGRWAATLLAVLGLVLGTAVPASASASNASAAALATNAQAGTSFAPAGVTGGPAKMSLAGWSAGNIISDAVFTDKSTLSEAQIQSFLNAKASKCQAGYTCLKDFRLSTPSRGADTYCSGYKGEANESAARILYKVAQSCGINPQVLVVMLQKEQGLVTHPYPTAGRYAIAMGFNCPDTAPCDAGSAGFFTQVYGAARQLQVYMEGKHFTWYAPGRTWNILFNPSVSCGSAPVYIANKATSALYYYTPYQPNAAALAAGYGEAKPCGAYGNRNFFNYFTDWFASTQHPNGPSLSSVNSSSFVFGIDGAGALWGYPFERNVWGKQRKLVEGLAGVRSAMMVGDLDGNGTRDMIVHQQNTVSVLRGEGETFGAPQPLALDWSGVVRSTAAGDVNGDGVPDVLTISSTGDLMLWRGDDKGGLLPAIRVGWGWSGMTALVGDIDLDSDGRVDVIGRDGSGRLFAYFGDGRGGWKSSRQIGQGWSGMTALFSAGDFTGDGKKDLAARTASGDLLLYPGDGKGAIVGGGRIGNGWHTLSALAGTGAAVVKPRALPAGVGDVDLDGAPDVVGETPRGTFHLYRGNGAGGWRGSKQIATGGAKDDRLIAMGDFNGDGYRDLGRITAGGVFWLLPGTAGGYGKPIQIGTGWQSLALVVGGVDFDGDRNPDVIARNTAGHLVYYRGDGRGGWASQAIQIGYGWGGFDLAVHGGDFNGDGHPDLIMRTTDSNLWLYPTDGRGGWGTARRIGVNWSGFDALFSPGDFDGNGTSDLLARHVDGNLYLFRGDGRGGWGASGVIGNGWNALSAFG